MAEAEAPALAKPIASHIRRADDGTPWLAGSRCGACGHTFVGSRSTCAKCYTRDKMETVKLAERGKVYTWSIIHRSFPGVEVPFIDVIVDLEDGAHIKGILKGVEADPDKIAFDLAVKVDWREIVPPGQKDKYLTYYFVPA